MIVFELGIIAGLLLTFWAIRRLTVGLRRERCLAVGAGISLGFLYLRVAAGALIVDFGRDPVALLERGLSLQNQIQAGVTLTAAIWAGTSKSACEVISNLRSSNTSCPGFCFFQAVTLSSRA